MVNQIDKKKRPRQRLLDVVRNDFGVLRPNGKKNLNIANAREIRGALSLNGS